MARSILAPVASAKTQPTDTPLETFLSGIDDPQRRSDAAALAELFGEVTGQPAVVWGTAIVGFGSYDTPTGPWPPVAFAARKQQSVLYLGELDEHVDLLAELGRHKLGKGCVYLPSVEAVNDAVLRKLVAAAYAARVG